MLESKIMKRKDDDKFIGFIAWTLNDTNPNHVHLKKSVNIYKK